MKSLALALVLSAPIDGSLGIGVDVLPEAFSFAAGKIGFRPRMDLRKCDAAACRWDLQEDVALAASFFEEDLNVYRVEVEWTPSNTSEVPGSRFQKACLAIVTLLQPQDTPAEQQAVAAKIANNTTGIAEIDADRSDSAISFFGGHEGGAAASIWRCGATFGSAGRTNRR